MSEAWRVKTYYDKRILIPTGDVLGAPRPDMLVCLTGVQASLLRNMCQYLHRRSTFVSEYRNTTYLAPTEAEWDDIQAIVAETEDILMGCEDYLALLQCICDGVRELKGVNWPAGGTFDGQPDYDDYTSPVEYEVGDPPALFATWDDWRDGVCIGAQKLFDDLSDLMAKLQVWYSAGAAITFSLFQSLVLASVVVPPVAVGLAIVEVLVVAYTALSVLAVEEWIGDHKHGLVCAVYGAATQPEAMAAIAAYVAENWDLLIGPQFFNLLVNQKVVSQIFDGTMPDWDDWNDEFSATYCQDCYIPGEGFTVWYNFGADCPKFTFEGDMSTCYDPGDGYGVIAQLWQEGHMHGDPLVGLAVGSYLVSMQSFHAMNRPLGETGAMYRVRTSVNEGQNWTDRHYQACKSNGDMVYDWDPETNDDYLTITEDTWVDLSIEGSYGLGKLTRIDVIKMIFRQT